MPLEIGAVVERYFVEAVLGEGGLATVYRVRHQTLSTVHALKVLNVDSRSVRQRLIQEGQVQAALEHPHIVGVRDVLDIDGAPGLLMEYVDGVSMEDWLKAHRPTTEEALTLFRGVVAGVGHAHENGLIHRDLKPANVMLQVTPDLLVPKVTDFGLAKFVRDPGGHTRTGTTMGTPAYMPPEQIRDASSVDRRADLYSLGIMLYELFCGFTPFEDSDLLELFAKIRAGTYTSPEAINPDVPETVVRCIEQLVTIAPADRLPDCEAVLCVLDGGTAEPSGEALAASRPLKAAGKSSLEIDSPGGAVAARLSMEKRTAVPVSGRTTAGRSGAASAETVAVSMFTPDRSEPQPPEPFDRQTTAETVQLEDDDEPLLRPPVEPTMPPLRAENAVGAPGTASNGIPPWLVLSLGVLVVVALLAISVPAAVWGVVALRDASESPSVSVAPVSDVAPAPAPVAAAAPAPEPPTAPEPSDPAPTAPEPTADGPTGAPPRTPRGPAPSTGTFRVEGARTAWIEVDGRPYRPGEAVPAGTWPLHATFDGSPTAVVAATVEVAAGGTAVLKCNPKYRRCAAQ